MKKLLTIAVAAFACCIALPVCAGDASLIGAATGAAIGGVLGSQILRHGPGQILTTAAGIGTGATVGDAAGRSFDQSTRAPVANAPLYTDSPSLQFTSAAPNYVAPPAPPPTYIDEEAQTYCRPYSRLVNLKGSAYETYGTACLQADGSWRIMQ